MRQGLVPPNIQALVNGGNLDVDAPVNQATQTIPVQNGIAGPPPANTEYETKYLSNPLSPYAQVAYNFKFYVDGDPVTPGGEPVIIAQTGVTGYNIMSVEMDMVPSPSALFRNTQGGTISIEIVEPLGASFLDGWYAAALKAGVKNWQKAIYKLELTFVGYNEDGSKQYPITEGLPNGGKWTWTLSVNTVETSLDTTGSRYTLSCTLMEEISFVDINQTIYEPTYVSATTVGEFFSTLKDEMNKSLVRREGDKDLIQVDFRFHPDDKGNTPETFQLETDPALNPYAPRSFNPRARDDAAANISAGKKIIDLVREIIGVTEEGQKYAMSAAGDIDENDMNSSGKAREAAVVRVYPQIEYRGYDEETSRYKITIIYNIKLAITQKSILNSREVENAPQNSPQAIAFLNERGALKKKYDYLYTGLNTEVIRFDVKYEFNMYALLPVADGLGIFNENFEPSLKYNDQQTPSPAGSPSAPSPSQPPPRFGDRVYAEELAEVIERNPLPVSTARANRQPIQFAGTGVPGQWTKGRSIYGAIMDQTNPNMTTGSLNIIDIEIKGDPYWLVRNWTDYFEAEIDRQFTADYTSGDVAFVVNVRIPLGQKDDRETNIKQHDIFNGVYLLNRVKSTFTEGSFKQVLTGTRAPLIMRAQATPSQRNTFSQEPGATRNTFGFE